MSKNVPRLRFNGFDDEWEEKTIGEVFTLSSGGVFYT